MGEDTEHQQRIKIWMAGCLIVVALFVDFFQFLLTLLAIGVFIAPVITVGATVLFWIWFKLLGISFTTSPKKFATFAIESVGELIPIVNALPMWTLGTIVTIIITRSEDKGGIIGKAAGVAQARINKRKAEIAAINRDIGNQMARFERPGPHVGGNTNTLDLRNRNAQDGKSPTGDKQQQQKPSNQSAGVEQEINNLKSNISGWQSEIQRLEQQLLEKEGRLKEHERSNREMIQTLRESGRADETRARELEEHGRQATMPLFSETVSLHNRIKWLKDSIWSGNNKLIELERKAGTLKMEAAKSGG